MGEDVFLETGEDLGPLGTRENPYDLRLNEHEMVVLISRLMADCHGFRPPLPDSPIFCSTDGSWVAVSYDRLKKNV